MVRQPARPSQVSRLCANRGRACGPARYGQFERTRIGHCRPGGLGQPADPGDQGDLFSRQGPDVGPNGYLHPCDSGIRLTGQPFGRERDCARSTRAGTTATGCEPPTVLHRPPTTRPPRRPPRGMGSARRHQRRPPLCRPSPRGLRLRVHTASWRSPPRTGLQARSDDGRDSRGRNAC